MTSPEQFFKGIIVILFQAKGVKYLNIGSIKSKKQENVGNSPKQNELRHF